MIPKYFEDIKDSDLYEFLKQNNIHWNKILLTNPPALIIPEDVARISQNSHQFQIYLSYKGLSDFFSYVIDDHNFILENEENIITINLSKQWQQFLEEFKKQNQTIDSFNA